MSPAKETTLSKFAWLRNLIVPGAILLIFVLCLSVYYLYWVPDRQRHLDDRGFRYLKTLNDQIRLTLNTYDGMMDHAIAAGIGSNPKNTVDELNKYLKVVDPTLQAIGSDDAKQVVGEDYADPPKIAVQADEGTHFLYLAFHPSEKAESQNFAIRADLDKLILRLLGSAELSPFDVLLVSRSDGKVIFQQSISGIEVAQIKNLEDPSGDAKGGSSKQLDVSLMASASRLADVRIAGALYRLYSQPVQIGFLPAHPERNGGKDAKGKTTTVPAAKDPATDSQPSGQSSGGANIADDTWVLCGLVRADRFRAESQLISYNYILLVLAAVVLAAAAYPLLKLYLSTAGERMLARDVTIAAIFVCLMTVVVTFVLADAYYWNAWFTPGAEKEMASLAAALNTSFEAEERNARKLVEELEAKGVGTDIAATTNAPNITLNYPEQDSDARTGGDRNEYCVPVAACRTSVLNAEDTDGWFATYPNLLFVAWSDKNGNQRVKWTTRKYPTPYIRLDDSSVPYYVDVRQALDENVPASSRVTQGIGSQYSPTTGQNITVFWKLTNSKATKGDRYITSLVTQPISLYAAVLPGGYQFAVVTPDGEVVFHSDYTRNLRENFFAETDKNSTLMSRVKMHAEGPLNSNYMGRPHRMYVLPMNAGNQNGLWSIVIFRDLQLEETMNLEIVSLVSIIFSFYASGIVLMLAVVYWLRKVSAGRVWFWPDSRNARRYRQILWVNLVVALLLLLISRYLAGGALLLCASVVPAAVLLANVLWLGGGKKDSDTTEPAVEDSMSRGCQTAYFAACVSVLVAICVVPCVCYFKAACNFEQKLLVQHQQLLLVKALKDRDAYFEDLYSTTNMNEKNMQIVFTPLDEQHVVSDASPGPIYSYHEYLKTRICPTSANAAGGDKKPSNDLPPCSDFKESLKEDHFLVDMSLPYSERFADEEHLAENLLGENANGLAKDTNSAAQRPAGVWKWTLGTSGNDRVLQLEVRESNKPSVKVASMWTPYFPWSHLSWWLWLAMLVIGLAWFVRSSLTRIFLLGLAAPPPLAEPEVTPASLISDLPVNLLIIGPESREPIAHLINRRDVQAFEAEELLFAAMPKVEGASEKPDGDPRAGTTAENQIAKKVQPGCPVVLRHFERLPDDEASATAAHAALLRLQSIADASVILLTSVDPQSVSSLESSERWRTLLRTYVRIELGWHSRRRKGEGEEDYQKRLSMESYYHWLISGMTRDDKLVLLQLAQERVVNPNSSGIVYQLMEQAMIVRKFGLLQVKDDRFAAALQHAIPRGTVHRWEKDLAAKKQFSLQTIMAVVGLGVIGFLAYTQGEIFNTWVTYAAGITTTLPKIVQFVDNFRPGKSARS